MIDNDLSVIKRLLHDAEIYVAALRKVESTLQRQIEGRVDAISPPSSQNSESSMEGTRDIGKSGNTGVKSRVGEIVRQSGSHGMRPRDVATIIQKEFVFRNRQTAAAAVSSALQRFKAKGKATKAKHGGYVWVEH